jgi:hypothetical protein
MKVPQASNYSGSDNVLSIRISPLTENKVGVDGLEEF